MVELVGGPYAGKWWPTPRLLDRRELVRVPVPAHKQDPQPMPSAAWPLFALYEARNGGRAAAFVRYEGETDEEVQLRRTWESIPRTVPQTRRIT